MSTVLRHKLSFKCICVGGGDRGALGKSELNFSMDPRKPHTGTALKLTHLHYINLQKDRWGCDV